MFNANEGSETCCKPVRILQTRLTFDMGLNKILQEKILPKKSYQSNSVKDKLNFSEKI